MDKTKQLQDLFNRMNSSLNSIQEPVKEIVEPIEIVQDVETSIVEENPKIEITEEFLTDEKDYSNIDFTFDNKDEFENKIENSFETLKQNFKIEEKSEPLSIIYDNTSAPIGYKFDENNIHVEGEEKYLNEEDEITKSIHDEINNAVVVKSATILNPEDWNEKRNEFETEEIPNNIIERRELFNQIVNSEVEQNTEETPIVEEKINLDSIEEPKKKKSKKDKIVNMLLNVVIGVLAVAVVVVLLKTFNII